MNVARGDLKVTVPWGKGGEVSLPGGDVNGPFQPLLPNTAPFFGVYTLDRALHFHPCLPFLKDIDHSGRETKS